MRRLERLSRNFFIRPTKTVAKDLLGRYLIRKTKFVNLIGRIIEVEAYLGPIDKACHTYKYRKTERTKIMYKKPGTLYVYFIYGMYHCLNVVTEPRGMPCAVLVRQLYPIEGIDLMIKNRVVKIGKNYKNLTDGPGKLCMALDITKEKFNGIDSCSPDAKVFFTKGDKINVDKINQEKRIGIKYAQEDKDKLLRYVLRNN